MHYHLQSDEFYTDWLSQVRADSCSLSVGCLELKVWGLSTVRLEEENEADLRHGLFQRF
jgi:hypothetical protein